MMTHKISSKDNHAVKALKKLLTSPKRSDARIVIEGIHACQAFLVQGGVPLQAWVSESAQVNTEIASMLTQLSNVYVLSDAIFRDLSILEQGVSLMFEVARPNLTGFSEKGNVIILDGVQDPGNMGSILRSAAAAGVHSVYLNSSCVNPFAPKVLRAAVGAHFSLAIFEQVDFLELFKHLREQRVQIVATSSYADSELYGLDLSHPVAWLFGNEGAGIDQAFIDAAEARVHIPMRSGESLNVAAAVAICLFEMLRQQK